MMLEAHDPELLNVHAQAYATALEMTMRASRRTSSRGWSRGARRWIGERLVRAGEALAAEPRLSTRGRAMAGGHHTR